MAEKIHFYWGCMGAGKSLELIRSAYNYREKNMDILIYKPYEDKRDGINECKITSRVPNVSVEADWILPSDNIFLMVHREVEIKKRKIRVVIIDEIQLFTVKQIEELWDVCLKLNIPVIVYGLKTDFQGHTFPSIIRLCDFKPREQEIRSICWCGKKATQNARICNGEVVRDGEQIVIGGNNMYTSLCLKHFLNGQLK